ncbi:MAG: 2-C-methyl-D-erythritol 4-phosphate cytidylyltransferase [Actinomycetia bacterium]|nr:2-C-methyl-D-erythritol 4-phosphate cytidylyltransferase [Actinomycetes bacterium]
MRTAAVIVAAGSGTRFGGPKHTVRLANVELWQRSVDAFVAAGTDQIVVVGDVPGGLAGGPRRRDSVAIGLAAVAPDTEWVLIHDAARPLITVELIARVRERSLVGDVDGVIPAIPVTDTIKSVDGESVLMTVDRSTLVLVQTPQAFRLSALREAHSADQLDATDDAAMVERQGGSVVHVMGDPMNFKITVPEDLVLASAWLRAAADRE